MNTKRVKGIIGATILGLTGLSFLGLVLLAGIKDERVPWWLGFAILAGITGPPYIIIKALEWYWDWRE